MHSFLENENWSSSMGSGSWIMGHGKFPLPRLPRPPRQPHPLAPGQTDYCLFRLDKSPMTCRPGPEDCRFHPPLMASQTLVQRCDPEHALYHCRLRAWFTKKDTDICCVIRSLQVILFSTSNADQLPAPTKYPYRIRPGSAAPTRNCCRRYDFFSSPFFSAGDN